MYSLTIWDTHYIAFNLLAAIISERKAPLLRSLFCLSVCLSVCNARINKTLSRIWSVYHLIGHGSGSAVKETARRYSQPFYPGRLSWLRYDNEPRQCPDKPPRTRLRLELRLGFGAGCLEGGSCSRVCPWFACDKQLTRKSYKTYNVLVRRSCEAHTCSSRTYELWPRVNSKIDI